MIGKKGLLLICLISTFFCQAQKFDLFEVDNNELIWRCTYRYEGPADSLRSEVMTMIKSKSFIRNVTRNEIKDGGVGYYGEIQHYYLDCERYGRRYQNTPLIYWSGEWKGKFIIEVRDNKYQVTIYGLYFENQPLSTPSPHQSKNPRKGYYLKEVWQRGHSTFKKGVTKDMALMSLSLRDAFDVKNYLSPIRLLKD